MTTTLTLNIKEGLIEFRQVNQEKYEVVKWQGDSCYVIGFYEYNKKEPDWYFRSVGTRLLLSDYEHQDDLWLVLQRATEILKHITF